LSEIVQQVAGAGVSAGLAEAMSGENDPQVVANTIAGAVGRAEEAASPEDTHWAVRRLLETLATREPVVVVVDDLHWADRPAAGTPFDLGCRTARRGTRG
jgi:hypothetical protein